MDFQQFLDDVHELTDLELAVLLSLVAKEHCLVATDDDLIDDLASELALIVSERFGLSYVVLDNDVQHSPQHFGDAIIDNRPIAAHDSHEPGGLDAMRERLASVTFQSAAERVQDQPKLDDRTVVNVIIAKGFNFASESVQVQAIEMIRHHRIYSHTTVHITPKIFLFIPIVTESTKGIQLTPHLNDRIFVSHFHNPQDGFVNLEELNDAESPAPSSSSSHQSLSRTQANPKLIDSMIIDKIREHGDAAVISPEVRRYLQDIVTFLRLERGMDGGVTPFATTQFVTLSRYLAALHGLTFVTPSLITLAARKIYPHRICITAPDRERSMQYGSDTTAVLEVLSETTPQTIIESVLETVQPPV